MDRVAVFVDAGYLFASGSLLLAGTKLPRGELRLDYAAVVSSLEEFAQKTSGLPLLRIYWYDGTSTGPTPQHLALAYLPNVKMRLGFVNRHGEQKGVDSLIVTDMIELARNRAMADAVLVSGDEDIRVGVQQAQEFGVRVHLLGIAPARGNQSGFLVQEADAVHEWATAEVERFLSRVPRAAASETTRSEIVDPNAWHVAGVSLAQDLPLEEVRALLATSSANQVPQEIDRKLLRAGSLALGVRLDPAQKRNLRDAFYSACRVRVEDAERS
jgi:uncharacterized LabA/DUF88 family protein